MVRYTVQTNQSVSTTAVAVNVYSGAGTTAALGLITAATKSAAIYEVIFGTGAVVVDAQVMAVLINSQGGALTAGTAIAPTLLDPSNVAAKTGASSLPTGFTIGTALPYLTVPFNTRATVRWAAVDPDARIVIPPAGGATGNLVVQNQQPGTVTGISLNHFVAFAE